MQGEPFFPACCPACGKRSLRDVRYLRLVVSCRCCHARFVATDRHADSASADDPVGLWLRYSEAAPVVVDEPSQLPR